MRRLLGDMGADVLHAHYLTGYGWIAWLAGFHPLIITVWGSDIFLTLRESFVARVWARLALGAADIVTADSDHLGRAAIAAGARRANLRILQFGVDTSQFTPGPPSDELRRRLDASGRRIVFLPRAVAPLYRTTVAVAALQHLPANVLLVLTEYNSDAAYMTEVRAAADRFGVADRIRYAPPIAHDEIIDFYRTADVVLSIPETDATPVSILEAMSCGRPIVATDLPSVREWLGSIDERLMVQVGDVRGTALAIDRLLTATDAEIESLRTSLRSLAVAKADHVANMLEVETLYRQLAESRR